MLKTVKYFVILMVLILISSCSERKESIEVKKGFSVKDDLNNRLYFNSAPKKVISLAPNLTEMIFALGAEDKLAGNTLFCSYPEEAKKISKVGDLITLDYEKILSINPDLILITVEGNTKDNYQKLKDMGFKMFISNPRNYEGIKKTFLDFGKIFNTTAKADSMIKEWDLRYKEVNSKKNLYPVKKSMFMVSLNPIMLAGKNTFINELMTTAGLDNIASSSPMNYPVFNREEIIKSNPDYIIMEQRFINEVTDLQEAYPEWKSVNAFKNKNVLFVDSYLYLTPGPRFIAALEDLFSKVHPQGK